MTDKSFIVSIVSPSGKKLDLEVELLNLKLSDGEIGIMKDHLPLIGIIVTGKIVAYLNNKPSIIAISGGVLNVEKGKVLILADSFETPEEIDLKRAEDSLHRAENRIKEHQTNPDIDVIRAEASLARALNRIEVYNNSK